ncbi:hypothetical protein B0A52_00334 [Exophiala mesophila]|uniref:Uncharacterized protein n=1 Tax=Exophiala mesophila TaxID=212818 RepID=A0A438NJR0_EXOME|nr:hypothetical protein B0A52_00334 [Exophiala mesophila]
MARSIIETARDNVNAVLVPMNKVRIAVWDSTPYLGTEGLNGCTGVAIISKTAGILAHIAPLPPGTYSNTDDAGHENLVAKMEQMISLYNMHEAHFLEARSCIVAAVHESAVALPEAVATIRTILHHLELPVKVIYYKVLESGTFRMPGQTSIVIDATARGWPKMYRNNQEVSYGQY